MNGYRITSKSNFPIIIEFVSNGKICTTKLKKNESVNTESLVPRHKFLKSKGVITYRKLDVPIMVNFEDKSTTNKQAKNKEVSTNA